MTNGWAHDRDSGRYDAITDSWIDSNVRVDFAWGNIPMQPDDDRIQGERPTLDPALDSHSIAVDGWSGFPAFIPNFEDRTSDYAPNVVGMTLADAQATIAAQGFVWSEGDSSTTSDGATSENEGIVAAQFPTAGTLTAGDGTTISTVTYHVAGVQVPSILGMPWPEAESTITGAGFVSGGATGSTNVGATETNANSVSSQSPAAGSYATAGSTISYVTYDFIGYDIAGIRYDAAINSNAGGYYLFITGRNNQPATDITIYVHGTNQDIDGAHTVLAAVNDDSFNTGGTKITITKDSATYTGTQIVGAGKWSRTNIF